jgi:hypothetical protein
MADPNQNPAQPPDPGLQLGVMYKRWTLDCIVTIAHAVSLDFSDQPWLYTKVDADTAKRLTELQADYGFRPNFPDMNIRQRLMKPIFGESDGHGNGNDGSEFQRWRLPALTAAASFAENAQPTGFPMLRKRVKDACDNLKDQMEQQGASLSETEKRTAAIFDVAQSILKDNDVAGRFGIDGDAINQKWPLESIDLRGAILIENITRQLPALPYGIILHDMFIHIQHVADDGFGSIKIILDEKLDNSGFDFTPLITELYAWGSDLGLVGNPRPLQQPPGQTTATEPAAPPPAASAPTTSTMAPAGYRQ